MQVALNGQSESVPQYIVEGAVSPGHPQSGSQYVIEGTVPSGQRPKHNFRMLLKRHCEEKTHCEICQMTIAIATTVAKDHSNYCCYHGNEHCVHGNKVIVMVTVTIF